MFYVSPLPLRPPLLSRAPWRRRWPSRCRHPRPLGSTASSQVKPALEIFEDLSTPPNTLCCVAGLCDWLRRRRGSWGADKLGWVLTQIPSKAPSDYTKIEQAIQQSNILNIDSAKADYTRPPKPIQESKILYKNYRYQTKT